MTYIEQARQALLAELGEIKPDFGTDLIDMYTLLVLTVGTRCTSGHVHDAWAVVRQRIRPDHWSIIPFTILAPEVQVLDDAPRDAIRRAAKRLNTGVP